MMMMMMMTTTTMNPLMITLQVYVNDKTGEVRYDLPT
jgi:hypothetical protein